MQRKRSDEFLLTNPQITISCIKGSVMCNAQRSIIGRVERDPFIMSAIENISAGISSLHECLGLVLPYDFDIALILFVKIPCTMKFKTSFVCERQHNILPTRVL